MAAIYQKARPIHWDEVVGQEHVKDVLRPALERGRIGHAYLFSGPRGVGKTTTARLIAMTVNCEDATAVKPCGRCESCKMVISGRHPDVLEIDAASNNSVDDVRDLREKVALQPMRGTRKVYILDEAHMMSKSAFNALLKTLEEPPAHVVFVLATTEPERMPPTILSRCQHYRFRRLSVAEIAGKLEGIASREGVNADRRALELIARASDGAMRDGESLLERLLASGEPVLTLSQAEGALGLPPQERIQSLALSLARAESGVMLEALGRLYADGFAPRTVTERVKIALRDVLHVQLGVGGLRADDDPLPEGVLLKLIRTLDEEDARFARSSDLISLEMAFTRALMSAHEPASGAVGVDPALAVRVTALERSLKEAGSRPARSGAPEFDPTARSSRPVRTPEVRTDSPPGAASVNETPSGTMLTSSTPSRTVPPRSSGTWGDVVTKSKARLKAFLREGRGSVMDGVVVVEYGPKHKWHAEQVAANLPELHELVQQVIGPEFDLELVMPDGAKKKSSKRANGLNLAAQPTRSDVQPSAGHVEPQPAPTQVNTPPQVPELERGAVVFNPAVIPISGGSGVMPSGQAGMGTTAVLEEPAVREMAQEAVLDPSPQVRSPERNLPERSLPERSLPETHRSAAQLRQGGPIPTAELEFDRLGQAASLEPGLFGLQPAPTPTLEDDARDDETAPSKTANVLETPSQTVSVAPQPLFSPAGEGVLMLESAPMAADALEVLDISALDDRPPLEAFDLDELESTDSTPASTVSVALQGHPTYAVLAKLFSHRVREAGVLEAEASQTHSMPDKVIPSSEPGGEEGEQV
jgi:DNA polymerase-3 subunit gamma/tau